MMEHGLGITAEEMAEMFKGKKKKKRKRFLELPIFWDAASNPTKKHVLEIFIFKLNACLIYEEPAYIDVWTNEIYLIKTILEDALAQIENGELYI